MTGRRFHVFGRMCPVQWGKGDAATPMDQTGPSSPDTESFHEVHLAAEILRRLGRRNRALEHLDRLSDREIFTDADAQIMRVFEAETRSLEQYPSGLLFRVAERLEQDNQPLLLRQ